ncbi:hypothetical protein [Candidatus Poriferisodalis sp.]|uniref:hypothetical protein n=1 Tax=Candidatus Poriferisodalis sp. TaxID=3101277 RepID=UPI003B02C7B9
MASGVVSVRLWLRQVKALGVLVDVPGGLVVVVCSTATRPVCSDCGERSGRVHDRRAKRVRDWGSRAGRPRWCGAGGGWCATAAGGGLWRVIGRSRAVSRLVWPAGSSPAAATCPSGRRRGGRRRAVIGWAGTRRWRW